MVATEMVTTIEDLAPFVVGKDTIVQRALKVVVQAQVEVAVVIKK